MVDSRTGGGVLAAVLVGLGGTVVVAGRQPPPVPAQEARPAPEIGVGYEADGRRDPFVSPIVRVTGGAAAVERPPGLPGLGVDEAVLRGVVMSREGYLAVLEAPDARTYVVRRADRLYDGTVQEVTGDAVLFLRDAAGAAPVTEREVRKRLRDGESAP